MDSAVPSFFLVQLRLQPGHLGTRADAQLKMGGLGLLAAPFPSGRASRRVLSPQGHDTHSVCTNRPVDSEILTEVMLDLGSISSSGRGSDPVVPGLWPIMTCAQVFAHPQEPETTPQQGYNIRACTYVHVLVFGACLFIHNNPVCTCVQYTCLSVSVSVHTSYESCIEYAPVASLYLCSCI